MTKDNFHQQHLNRLEKGENLSPQDEKVRNHILKSRAKYLAAGKELLDELRSEGFDIVAVQDLRASGKKYPRAIPILAKWLPKIKYDALRNDIVRTLSVPWGKPAAEVLINEFKRATLDEEKNYRAAIGIALEAVAQKKHFSDLASIVKDQSAGYTRAMVIRALGKINHPDASDVLLEILQNGEEVGHILFALRRLKTKVSKDRISPYLTHELPWVRKEAKKLLELQDKLYKN
ncbi:HEAT repeat domain-containing protein [Acanthopleuribacter pedis]|uniref:HEAT repeat domain-containing protein n=1 Tax=Acanthopleuribacter pedis TaxID=442870 RepID=A0A8J7U285_9BACT|nr:HEAT repeat domain-containing protein [Acanthopleuribacter pedis]MBO1319023.1 HEAT repeat domain-containing protein [Acanthopleuribacter pedis]